MIKKIIMFSLAVSTVVMVTGATRVFALTEAQKAVCEGAGITASSNDCSGDTNTPQVDNVISTAVNILSSIVGIVGVVMVFIGGFKYITSRGDSNAVSSAKSTITYAIIGLIIAALAQVLVHFVLFQVTNDATHSTPPGTTSGSGVDTGGAPPPGAR